MMLDVDVTAERRHYNTHRPLKGKQLTTFCASLRSGGRRLAVRTAMEHPIGTLPRTPFPASRDFPSRGNEGYGEKNRRVIYFMYHSGVSPFGAVRHQRGESHRRWLITVVLFMPYDTESQSRNADFMFIARKGDTTTLGAKGPVKLKNPPAAGRSILRTFPFTTLRHNLRRQPRPFF